MAGNYTFQNFQDYLVLRLGKRTDLTTPVNYASVLVNEAYLDLTTKNKSFMLKKNFVFPELETFDSMATVAHQAYITTPSSALIVRNIWDYTNDKRLTNISFVNYLARTGRAVTANEGIPTYWNRQGAKTYLYVTPASAYNINVYYRQIPNVMSSVDDTTAIDASWDEVVLDMAVIKGFTWLQQFENAELAQKDLINKLTDKMGIYDKEDLTRQDIFTPSVVYYDNDYK